MSEETRDSRREVLKKGAKAAAFMIPVMISFKLDDCKACASLPAGKGNLNVRASFRD